jgi:hypothetical protein
LTTSSTAGLVVLNSATRLLAAVLRAVHPCDPCKFAGHWSVEPLLV